MHWKTPLPLAGPVSGPPQIFDLIVDEKASSVATYDLTWTKDYRAILVEIMELTPVTNNTILQFRTSGDGGATFDGGASDYRTQSVSVTNLLRFAQLSSHNSIYTHATANQMASSGGWTGTVVIAQPFEGVRTAIYGQGGYLSTGAIGPAVTKLHGHRNAAARVDGFRMFMDVGDIASVAVRAVGVLPLGEA